MALILLDVISEKPIQKRTLVGPISIGVLLAPSVGSNGPRSAVRGSEENQSLERVVRLVQHRAVSFVVQVPAVPVVHRKSHSQS